MTDKLILRKATLADAYAIAMVYLASRKKLVPFYQISSNFRENGEKYVFRS